MPRPGTAQKNGTVVTSYPAIRAGRHVAAPTIHAPNAALMIDFDNVTLGVRSDLAKELRTLLNSDIIKGKVAVQRAYADWRRYPQYIVPLSESSIDLIFAPAFGTNKKNATDIRLAVDAIELVFTRPEIGTFILLSGDSDFSSMVLKLKEYGKYVIGVGIRESASDILIQNCDEYYSYSDLAGLAKEADAPATPRDPWDLVAEAVRQMAEHRDVMRSDRLKQVMQQLDPNFDERTAGYNRFSKFVTEAGTRGLIRVIKQENGQFEVAPVAEGTPRTAAATAPARRSREGGRHATSAPAASAAAPASPAPATPRAEGEERPSRRRRGGRGRGRSRGAEEGAAPAGASTPTAPATAAAPTGLTLAEAFHLLSRALGELPAPVPSDTLRARMAALHAKEDVLLEPARFAMLLRQANDAEIADVRMLDATHFEVSPHKSDLAFQMRSSSAPAAEAAPAGDGTSAPAPRAATALRYRGGSSRANVRSADVPMVGVIDLASGSLTPLPATPATNGNASAAAAVSAPATAAVAEAVPAGSGRSSRGRGRSTKKAAAPAAKTPAAKAKAAPKEKKPSPRRPSKPRAG